MRSRALALLVVGLLAAPVTANAAFTTYFAENQTPGGTVSGTPVTARNSFLSSLFGVGSEGFESYTANPPSYLNPLLISFPGSGGNITATLSGGGEGVVDANYDTPVLGRFNTTAGGSKWWLANAGVSLDFSSPVSAFGFYGTDIGDFSGQLTLALTDVNDAVTNVTIAHTIDGANGSLLFYGFIDTGTAYKRISFGTTTGDDFFGFDDFVIGDRQQISVPEPGTLALLGLGLAGLAASRRRKT